MRQELSSALIVCSFLTVAFAQQSLAADDDSEIAHATWKCVSTEENGKVYGSGSAPYFSFQNGKLTTQPTWLLGSGASASYALGTTTTPRQLDVTITSKDGTTAAIAGIYQLSGDQITWCYSKTGDVRPTSFATTNGDGRTILTLVRHKPLNPEPGSAERGTQPRKSSRCCLHRRR